MKLSAIAHQIAEEEQNVDGKRVVAKEERDSEALSGEEKKEKSRNRRQRCLRTSGRRCRVNLNLNREGKC